MSEAHTNDNAGACMQLESLEAVEAAMPACTRAPIGLLAELTYRCPLRCPYCSNPVDMQRGDAELTTAEWQDVMRQAGALGVLQVHLSGGEPTVRQDLEQILEFAVAAGLYTNLITSSVTLTRERLTGLAERGLDHVQLSIQDAAPANADRISGYRDGALKKRGVARWVRELSLPLTINAVIHRQNIENLPAIIDYAVEVGAGRLEVAHTQYYAWALVNRAALIPTREQFLRSVEFTNAAKERLKGYSCSMSWPTITMPYAPSLAWAAGGGTFWTSRPRARCCRAMPVRRSWASKSITSARSRWQTSGSTVKRSRNSAAPNG
jgi:PqqA peptide cyclase